MNYVYPEFELSSVLGKNAKPFVLKHTFNITKPERKLK